MITITWPIAIGAVLLTFVGGGAVGAWLWHKGGPAPERPSLASMVLVFGGAEAVLAALALAVIGVLQ